MAVTTHGNSLVSTSQSSTYTTTSFTPAAGDLLAVFVGKTGSVNNGSVTDSLGGTYTLVRNASKNASADFLQFFIADQLASGSALTITYDCTGDGATGCIIFAIRVSGMTRTGAAAISQNAAQSNQSAATTPAPAFSFNCDTNNPTLGFVLNATNPAAMTAPTSWAELIADVGYGTPTTGGEYVTRDSGFTGTTITWGSTSPSAYGDIIVELDTSVPSGGAHIPFRRIEIDRASSRAFDLRSRPRFMPVPVPPQLPASPVIPFSRGQWYADSVRPLVGTRPRHLPFPYFIEPPLPANPVVPIIVPSWREWDWPERRSHAWYAARDQRPRYFPLIIYQETFNPYEAFLQYDVPQYSPSATVRFEAIIKSSAGVEVKARLFNITDGIEVPGSEIITSSTLFVRLRSGVLALSGTKEYRAEVRQTVGETTTLKAARLIVQQ